MSWKYLNKLSKRRNAYVSLFLGDNGQLKPEAEIVLRDLKNYCRANSIIGYRRLDGAIDPLGMANANGRREVWDRVIKYIMIPEEVNLQLSVTKEDEYA